MVKLARRRVGAVAAIALAATLALTACGKDSTSSTDGGNGVLGDASATPSASADASTTPTAAPSSAAPATSTSTSSGGSGGGNSGSSYPSTAKDYGLEVLKAIGNKNQSRLNDLSSQNIYQAAADGGLFNLNTNWTYVNCSGGATQTCYYYNNTVRVAGVTMETAKLGGKGAASSVSQNNGDAPTDPAGYVGSFAYAWSFNGGSGDTYALLVGLSSAQVAGYFTNQTPYSGLSSSGPAPCPGNSSKTCITIFQQGGTTNPPDHHLIIDTGKISQGRPGGITGYVD